MPKVNIDYSKTIIYKIVCKDLEIKYSYVGHTTHFTKRKNQHKGGCKETSNKHNLRVYQTIVENGGWDNRDMIEIETFPCENRNEATKRERFWYETLNANMNSQVPDGLNPAIYRKKYYDNNQEEILNQKKEYYEENKIVISDKGKIYRDNNKEIIKERKKLYYLQNRESILAKCKLLYKNKEK